MTSQTYQAWTKPLRQHPYLLRAMRWTNLCLTCLLYASYSLLLLFLFLCQDSRLLRVFLVPGVSFVLVTLFRKYYNAPRPYEMLDIKPLIPKKTKGCSFPSRHVFSISILAVSFWYICPWIGIVILCCSGLMAAIRVLGGVHFPRDVIAGFLIGILCGIIGFILL